MRQRWFVLVATGVAACGARRGNESPAGPSTPSTPTKAPVNAPANPVRIPPLEPSRTSGPCADLDYCECVAKAECAPRFTEGCVCSCDFICDPAQTPCMCACGGARYAACESPEPAKASPEPAKASTPPPEAQPRVDVALSGDACDKLDTCRGVSDEGCCIGCKHPMRTQVSKACAAEIDHATTCAEVNTALQTPRCAGQPK